jgi:hypothetical protein
VCIQVLMLGLTILFPSMVMHYKGKVVDPNTIEIKMPDLPGLGLEPFGTQPPAPGKQAPAAPDLSTPPSFGEPGKPAAPVAPDLSQPPSFN